MTGHPQNFGIVGAIPGARAALRWCGWAGIGLLVVPAVMLAVLAAISDQNFRGSILVWALVFAGVLALLGAGYAMTLVLSSLRRMTELAQVLCERSNGPCS